MNPSKPVSLKELLLYIVAILITATVYAYQIKVENEKNKIELSER